MKIAVIVLNEYGRKIGERVVDGLGDKAVLYVPDRLKQSKIITAQKTVGGARLPYVGQGFIRPDSGLINQAPTLLKSHTANYYSEDLSALTRNIFHKYDGLVFIMALGIVIRTIAPHIRNKLTDPAVVVVDDAGRFVISALSGHEGGANELAIRIANILKAEPVITTGSEARKDLIVGVGCRKGISTLYVREAIIEALREAGCVKDAVRFIATVDLKAKEKGLLDAARELGIPLRIISREEISSCAKSYSPSRLVTEKLGIGGVCEPAALLGGRRTRLILKKKIYKGVTVAIARENFS